MRPQQQEYQYQEMAGGKIPASTGNGTVGILATSYETSKVLPLHEQNWVSLRQVIVLVSG